MKIKVPVVPRGLVVEKYNSQTTMRSKVRGVACKPRRQESHQRDNFVNQWLQAEDD